MIRPLHDLPTVLTCFALRQEYMQELKALLLTVKRYHPDWPVVIGRGTIADRKVVFEVDAPDGKCQWIAPVLLELDGSQDDWRRVTRLKAWWVSQVWSYYGAIVDPLRLRVVWLDADARLNGPLDFTVDPDIELVAGPWWIDPEGIAPDTIASGLLLFQGCKAGPMAKLIEIWRDECLRQIQHLPASVAPWPDGDQEVLTALMMKLLGKHNDFDLLKLDLDKYCGIANHDGTRIKGAIVDQWQMSRKFLHNQEGWPPPEEQRNSSCE